jgi:glycosyltransferase involved in cell wall biosynthesis
MKILLSAFACQPGLGSEPGVGWNLATHLAREHQITVLTDTRNRAAILRNLEPLRERELDFHFVEAPAIFRWGAGRHAAHYVYYLSWQLVAVREAAKLVKSARFDLIHHVTYVNSWMPSLMGRLGVKFVWSAGTRDTTPPSFLSTMSWRGRAAELTRTVFVKAVGRANRLVTARHARLVLSSSPPTSWQDMPHVAYFPLGGLSNEECHRLERTPIRQEGPYRAISVGRLLALKGFSLGIAAFCQVLKQLPGSEYVIIGDGPERRYLERQAQELGIRESVRFAGHLPREDVFRHLENADVLVHPSLHEQFGYVVMEAMAAGRPALCLDVGPFPALVADRGGSRIPLTNPPEAIEELATKLIEWGQNRGELARAGQAARAWALQQWRWEAVTERLMKLYGEIR